MTASDRGATVGIVVVSHSDALARAAVALAEEMVQGATVAVEVAAGLDDHTFGTDAVRISEAITAADGAGGAGVLVLMDLGSAVLSAELALELVDDDVRERVTLCPAPLVEGLVVAAVAAAGGADRADVAAEAAGALAAKLSHLGVVASPPVDATGAGGTGSAPVAGEDATATGRFTVRNPHGLHARPVARLAREARDLDARVALRNLTTGAGPVPATSFSRVATLGVERGHEVEVRAVGVGADAAVSRLLELAGRDFDEPADAAGPAPEPAERPEAAAAVDREAGARGAAPGVAVGPVVHLAAAPVPGDTANSGDTADAADMGGPDAADGRLAALRTAIGRVRADLERRRAATARDLGPAEAAIFEAHAALLEDPELVEDATARIRAGAGPARAWRAAAGAVEAALTAVDDPYLQARAADVRAVGEDVLRALTGTAAATVEGDGVLVAADLDPAGAADLDPARVLGVVLAGGSPTSHSAILARARGVPMVVGAGPAVLDVPAGTAIALDGTTGEVVVDPPADVRDRFAVRAARERSTQQAAAAASSAPARTRDGVDVLVAANVGSVDDARAAAAAGADGVGLVRTEFLFLGRDRAPDVDEQEATYRAIAEAMGGRRVTLRTLDVGGDKPLPYVPMAAEANPFLGVRGLRLSLTRPELFEDQLLAVVRTARDHPVDVMFPMVSTVAELRAARAALDRVTRRTGTPPPAGLRVGMMVEVPAAALAVAGFAPLLDFVSIGTNDLVQYTLAAERGNGAVAHLADGLDPAVLRLVGLVCRSAPPGAPVTVCGELAADPAAVALLVGLGVRELSVTPRAVPSVKQAVRAVDAAAAGRLAADAVAAPDAAAVRALR